MVETYFVVLLTYLYKYSANESKKQIKLALITNKISIYVVYWEKYKEDKNR